MTETIDPQWAWAKFEPQPGRPWNLRSAAHLFRRAGFGASGGQLSAAVEAGPVAAVDELLEQTVEPAAFQHQIRSLAQAALATGRPEQLSAWWAYRMLETPAPLLEKITLFWHGHFATSAAKVEDADLMFEQNRLLRESALGRFDELLLEISRDPAMLIYLDSATNRKAHPNENYAREIMELFCLGEGQYTEDDIRELARCFTGWEVKRKKYRFNRYQHDTGIKSFLGERGAFGGEDGVRIVAGQDAAPRFIATKLVHYFVMDEPTASADLVAPLAEQLRHDNMHIQPLVRRILTSNLFYSEHAVGRKVRSPVDLAVGFLRSLDGSANTFELSRRLRQLGQGLFYPPSVKGWDGGRTWINSSTLLGRSNLIRDLLEHEKTRFDRLPLSEYLTKQGADRPDEVMDLLEERLFAVPIPAAARDRIRQLAGDGQRDRQLHELVQAVCTLPEFQLG